MFCYQFPQLTPFWQNQAVLSQQPVGGMMGMPMYQGNASPMIYGQQPQAMTSMPMYQGNATPTIPMGQASPANEEESYIENILRLNLGKTVSVYMNFENSQWGSKIFKGTLEAAGKDHIILSDPTTNMRYLLLSIYLNYVTFDEEINYFYPYHPQQAPSQR